VVAEIAKMVEFTKNNEISQKLKFQNIFLRRNLESLISYQIQLISNFHALLKIRTIQTMLYQIC